LCVGVAVEINEVVRGGRRELWQDCVWWFRWGSCSGGDPWVVVSYGWSVGLLKIRGLQWVVVISGFSYGWMSVVSVREKWEYFYIILMC